MIAWQGVNYLFIILLLYIASRFYFKRLRVILNFMTVAMAMIFILNDWDNTVVPDDTLKLSFLLSFLLYGYISWYNIYIEE